MRKYAFKFDRQIQGTEACDATVLAEDSDEALIKFNNREWASFLIQKRDVNTDMSDTFINEFKDIGLVQ